MSSMLFRRSRRAAFTLVEMMCAVAIFAVGGSIVYPLLSGDMDLYARNFSINKSNNSLRYSLQMLRRDIDMGIEPPVLMGYTSSGSTGVLSALSSTAVSAQAVLIWVNLGPAYDLIPTAGAGTGGTISPATGVNLRRASASPAVQIGDRLIILSPSPYSTGMPDAKATCGAVMQAPGRRITGITTSTATALSVTLDLTTSLPSGITGDQTAYIVREVAYVAKTINDSSGNPAERDLIYYPTTSNMSSSQVLVRDLDPLPQEIDPNTSATIQPFNFYGGRGSLSPLSVSLPVRAFDYAHALNDRNLGTAKTNTSSTEFDVYLRSATQLGVKARLD
jgi:prepilin-type N-terminal cleavage/methylation domain-containing protein